MTRAAESRSYRPVILWFSALLLLSLAGFLPSAKAADFDLAQFKGKVVYLDFWASWCAPCRLSFPWMQNLATQFGAQGLVVVAANVDHDRTLADAFLRQTRPSFPIVFDPAGALAAAYRVKAMPTTVIIGRDGKVLFTHDGFFEGQKDQYLADIKAALNEGPFR